jgi:hypothetical protein
MLITFAFSFIGVLLVFGNYKILRRPKPLIIAFIVTILLASAGIYLIRTSDMENPFFVMVLISPLIALLLLEISRMIYFRAQRQEIILYLGGFVPKRFEERFVSRFEKLITFIITALALWLSYLIIAGLGQIA